MQNKKKGVFSMNEKKIYTCFFAIASSVFGGSSVMVSNNVAKLNENVHELNTNVVKLYEIQKSQNDDIKRLELAVKDLKEFRLRVIESGIFRK